MATMPTGNLLGSSGNPAARQQATNRYGGRDADRAAAVVGVRDRHHAGCRKAPGPMREAARCVVGIPPVTDRSQPRVFGHGMRSRTSDNCVLPRDTSRYPAPPVIAVGDGLYGTHASVPSRRQLSG